MAQADVALARGAKVQKKKNRNSIERKKERTAYLFIALPVLYFVAFRILPTFFSFFLSFMEWDLLSPQREFIGFENYVTAVSDPTLQKVFGNTFGMYTRIALPLVTPALSALGIFTFLGNWNSFLWPVIALDSKEKYTITLGLAQFSAENASQWELIMTGASVATIPIIIIFLIFQKKIIEGVQLTGVKG